MRRWVLIALAIILLCITCKATASPNDRYEFCMKLDELINQVRDEIKTDTSDEVMSKTYFEIIHIKHEFLKTCKDKTTKNYYEKALDKCNIYIGNAICEKDERWLDEALLLLNITFGDYKNNKMKYIK